MASPPCRLSFFSCRHRAGQRDVIENSQIGQ
jgi:hypothetical protein